MTDQILTKSVSFLKVLYSKNFLTLVVASCLPLSFWCVFALRIIFSYDIFD